MKYDEITIKTNSATSDIVAYFLQTYCLDGITIYDKNDLLTNSSWDYVDDHAFENYVDEVIVKGYCLKENTQLAVESLKQDLAFLQGEVGSLQIFVKEVDDASWIDEWKKYFVPIDLGDIVVCPKWEKVTPKSGQKVLYLDSGISFGTGQHETTSLCIELMQSCNLKDAQVCDVGCGSGILGLSALLLGAESAVMVDIDEQAVEICLQNAIENNLQDKCEILCGNLTEKINGTFNVVFANLTADILLLLAKDIHTITNEDTILILSGILTDRCESVKKCYNDLGFNFVEHRQKGEWSALILKQ